MGDQAGRGRREAAIAALWRRPRTTHPRSVARRQTPRGIRRTLLSRLVGPPRRRLAERRALEHLERQQRALHARGGDVDPQQVEHERLSSASSSSTGMPLTSSEAIEAAACEIAQPCPEKRRSATRRSSSSAIWTRSSSPHSGLMSSNSRSGTPAPRPAATSCGVACSARGCTRDRGRPSLNTLATRPRKRRLGGLVAR